MAETFDLDIDAMGHEVLLQRARLHERLAETYRDRHTTRLHGECAALYRHAAESLEESDALWDGLVGADPDEQEWAIAQETGRTPASGPRSRMP